MAEQTPGSNARNYRYLSGAWRRFRPDARWTDITPATVGEFDSFMSHNLSLSVTTRGRYLQVLRALCRRAARLGQAPAPVATAFAGVSSKRPVRAPESRCPAVIKAAAVAPVRWYAFRLARHVDSAQFLSATTHLGLTTYYPLAEISRRVGGAMRKAMRPVIPSIIFIHTSAASFHAITCAAGHLGSFIGRSRPIPIPDDQMHTFALVIDRLTPDMTVAEASDSDWSIGRHVTITGGPFAGYSGLVASTPDPSDPRSIILIRLLHHRLKVLAHIPTPFLQS